MLRWLFVVMKGIGYIGLREEVGWKYVYRGFREIKIKVVI